ncbi:DsbA family protein [Nonomuraea sp. NPDC050536]|uniref:DsbA family protein n=1 Tax=Nonomuraea sp. NPDC050536 TaxID=3364366 RepID=UPI0037CA54D6
MRTRFLIAAVSALAVLGIVALAAPGRSAGVVGLVRQQDGSMVLAASQGSAPVLDLYEDFDCPVCKELHSRVNGTVLRLAREGKVKVVFHTVTIFRDEPMRSNSIRAAAAARCVPETSWLAFRDELYGMQPAPHGEASGFTVEELVKAAHQAGATDVDSCITRQSYAQEHLAQSNRIPLDGTPTVVLDGQQLGDAAFDAAALERAITGGQGTTV